MLNKTHLATTAVLAVSLLVNVGMGLQADKQRRQLAQAELDAGDAELAASLYKASASLYREVAEKCGKAQPQSSLIPSDGNSDPWSN